MHISNAEPVIAIVDDDPSIRRAFSQLMRAFGLKTETFGSAEEFLANAQLNTIGCLLLDVQMGGMSGIEMLDILASKGDVPPTIVITAFGDRSVHEQARRHGTALLEKPVESERLVEAVGQAIGRNLN